MARTRFFATLRAGEVDSFLAAIKGRLDRKTQLLQAGYATFGFRDIIDHFKQEEGPDGKWEPRSKSTQERYRNIRSGRWKPPRTRPGSSSRLSRRQFDPNNKILQMTGKMRQSIISARRKSRRVNKDSILVFAADNKSGLHDRGGKSALGFQVPQRQFMWLSDEAMEKFASFVLDGVVPK